MKKSSLVFLHTILSTKFRVPPFPRRFYCSCSSPSSPPSSNKLFVGGLSWSVDEKSLKDAFSSFGDVTEGARRGRASIGSNICKNTKFNAQHKQGMRIVYDKDSGRSRGFGFVIFSNEDDAKCAKDAMDGKALLGRPLRINFALEKARGVPVVVPRLSDIGHLKRH